MGDVFNQIVPITLAWSIAKFSSCTVNGRPSGLASVSRKAVSSRRGGALYVLSGMGHRTTVTSS